MPTPTKEQQLTPEQAAEADLLKRATSGDESALASLLMSRHQQLQSYIERQLPAKLQAKISAEDLMQQTYLQVFKSIGAFEPKGPGAFFGWLKTIASRKLIDATRQAGREKVAPKPAGAAQSSYQSLQHLVAESGAGAGTLAMADELRGAFHIALANLPENYREVVRMRYLDERSLEEVAQHLEITTGAARGLCHRARQALRDEILRLSRFI